MASASNIYKGTGTTTTADKYSGAAYIFDAGIKNQEALYKIICGGATIGEKTEGWVGSATVTSGVIDSSKTKFSYGVQSTTDVNTYSYYFVIVDSEKAFFSTSVSAEAGGSDTEVLVSFGTQKSASKLAPTTTGFAGAGAWSSTAAVPEPTSAMLLMLGLCGLALKRKNA